MPSSYLEDAAIALLDFFTLGLPLALTDGLEEHLIRHAGSMGVEPETFVRKALDLLANCGGGCYEARQRFEQ